MAILVQDSFNRANSTAGLGTADTGQTWQALAWVWGIQNNQAYWVSGNPAFFVVESGQSDVQITLDNIVISAGQAGGVLAFRVSDSSNYWLYRNLSSVHQLYKFVGGTATLVSSISGSLSAGTHQIKIIANGSVIECYIDDALQISVTDTFNQTATKHGLRNHTTTTTRFDNFLVETLSIGGGSTGTDGSITLGLTQQIYSDSSVNLSLSQQIYADISANLNLVQSIYRDTETLLGLNQTIYKDDTAVLPLTQAIYRDADLGLNLRQEIYAEAESILNLIQEFYEDSQTFITLQLIQEIYEDDSAVLNLSQSIYKDSFSTLNTVQQMYTEGEISLPLLIQIRDDLVNLIGTIRLVGKRVLNIPLQGKRELNVTLLGGIDVTAINQNFSMIAGDTKNLIIPMPEDLTGCTVKWGLRQRAYSTENLINKSTNDGITVNGTEITIKLAPTDTQSLQGVLFHECEVTDQLGNVSTIFTGNATISRSGI
jgi:hypothetical protein